MKYTVIFALCVALFSCKFNKEEQREDFHPPKTLLLKSYSIPELTPEAREKISNWKTFFSFYRVMVNLAPNNVMSNSKLLGTSKDSLIIYKRLYPQSENTLRENLYVDRDWHTPKTPTDTIYRLTSDDKTKISYLQWRQKLVKNVQYVFNGYFQGDNSKGVILKVAEQEGEDSYKTLLEESFLLDTIFSETEHNYSKISDIGEQWYYLELLYTPKNDGEYLLQIALPESQDSYTKNLLFYTPSLKIKNQDFSVINELSSDLIDTHIEVKSSYNSVYFWLEQMQDELNLLLKQDQFPKKLNTPILKSRFHLLDTRIKELKDEVKNNPNLNDDEVSRKIYILEEGFGYIVESINTLYNDNLDTLMEKVKQDLEHIQKVQAGTSENLLPDATKQK